MSWIEERYAHLTIATDASAFKYGFVVNPGCDFEQSVGDVWAADDQSLIHLKVAEGVSKAILSTGEYVHNCSLDVYLQVKPAMICLLNAGPYFTNSICDRIDLFIAKPFMFWLCIIIIPQT